MFLLFIRVCANVEKRLIKLPLTFWCRDRVFFAFAIKEEEPLSTNHVCHRNCLQESVAYRSSLRRQSFKMDLSHLSARRRRFAEDYLYSFTGLQCQCVRAWFNDIEMVADMIHEADHSVLLKFAVQNLIDGSERWYKTHQHNLTTWSDFKQRMIKQFDTRVPPSGTDFIMSSRTPMKERRRTIAWHPQHVAHYKSYHSKKSSVVDHQSALSVPHFSIFQLDPFEATWPHGDQSWVDTEPKPQRENFAIKQSTDFVPNDTTHTVIEMKPDSSKIIVKPDSFWPDGQESWHIHEMKPQRGQFAQKIIHPFDTLHLTSDTQLALDPIDASAKVVSMLDEASKPVPIVPFVNSPLREAQPVFQPPIIPHALKLKQRRYHSLQTDPIHIVSLFSRQSLSVRSNHVHHNPFLRMIGTSIALLSFFLLSLLLRFGIIHHSVHDSDGIGGHYRTTESIFVSNSATPIDSKKTFNILIPYVTTIETLRHLESLLIYGVT